MLLRAWIAGTCALLAAVSAAEAVGPSTTWPCEDPEALGLDDAKLDEFVAAVGGSGVIVKDGFLVKTWGCVTCDFNWGSAEKPVVSTLLFFAIEEGLLTGVDDLLADQGWSMQPGDESLSFRHLANNTSGYARGEGPTAAWAYNDYAIALYKKTLYPIVYGSNDADDILKDPDRLGPLDFEDGPVYHPSSGSSGFKLNTSVRDFARIGQFWLDKGRWEGQQLLPEHYFDDYAKPFVPGALPRTTLSGSDYLGVGTDGGTSDQTPFGPGIYGFNWWFNGFAGTSGERVWPDVPADAYQANGHWNEDVVTVIPSLGIVAAWTGTGDPPDEFADFMNDDLKLLVEAAPAPAPAGVPAAAASQLLGLAALMLAAVALGSLQQGS